MIETKGLSIQSRVLDRQIEADNEAFQAVLKRLNEESSQARSQPVFIQVVDSASPAFKVKPKPVQVIAIAVFLSLAAAAATIFLLASLDTSFKSVDELESVLGLQVLAAIPQYEMTPAAKKSKAHADGPSVALPLLDDPYSAASEAYRTLRAALLLHEDEGHSILVTSAVPEEGKSTTSLSLAISMAQRGTRTVLIEADLRKPVMQKRLLGEEDHRGLSDFLSDQADFDEIVQETPVPNLYVITAGRVNKNSGELLLRRPRVEKMLQLARGQFEQVIVDSAPLLAVSDTLTIAKHFKSSRWWSARIKRLAAWSSAEWICSSACARARWRGHEHDSARKCLLLLRLQRRCWQGIRSGAPAKQGVRAIPEKTGFGEWWTLGTRVPAGSIHGGPPSRRPRLAGFIRSESASLPGAV